MGWESKEQENEAIFGSSKDEHDLDDNDDVDDLDEDDEIINLDDLDDDRLDKSVEDDS